MIIYNSVFQLIYINTLNNNVLLLFVNLYLNINNKYYWYYNILLLYMLILFTTRQLVAIMYFMAIKIYRKHVYIYRKL